MTADRAALLALADRIEALTEPSREVDAEVWCALGMPLNGTLRSTMDAIVLSGVAPKLTASLDAAMALKDELLPGWDWMLKARVGLIYAELESADTSPDTVHSGEALARAAPCALVAAVLRAGAAAEAKEADGG